MRFGPFEGVVQRAYLRLYDVFSRKKALDNSNGSLHYLYNHCGAVSGQQRAKETR